MLIEFAKILFWASVYSLLHTYLIYPLLVILLSRFKKHNNIVYNQHDDLPEISIIMAVHNEEKVIVEKIESILQNNYPKNKITCFIGSDASTDRSDQLIIEYANKHQNIKFERFTKRSGKIQILNQLVNKTADSILVFTDANAILSESALYELIKHFKNNKIKVVGGRLFNRKHSSDGIAIQENAYMEAEFKLKIAEGKLWGCMMGAYGAFYAIRKEDYCAVPEHFMVDDFYISVKAIEKGGRAICDPAAIAYEDVPGNIQIEFKRKSRIATGNFQNLAIFIPKLFTRRISFIFSFLSHKVLRWLGPVYLLFIFISLFFLFNENKFYTTVFIISLLSLLVPIIDFFHRKIKIHVLILRFITHFYYMNAALFAGLLNYVKGVKSNVWEPTKRQ